MFVAEKQKNPETILGVSQVSCSRLERLPRAQRVEDLFAFCKLYSLTKKVVSHIGVPCQASVLTLNKA